MTKQELTIQSPEDISLQKYKSSLIASGGAMVLFAIWTVLRSVVQLDAILTSRADSAALMPMVSALISLSVIDLFLKIYVGMSARQEGLGRKKKRPYLTLGIIIAAVSVVSVLYMLFFEFPEAVRLYGLIVPIVTMAVEVTVLYASLDLVISARKVRKLEKEMGRA